MVRHLGSLVTFASLIGLAMFDNDVFSSYTAVSIVSLFSGTYALSIGSHKLAFMREWKLRDDAYEYCLLLSDASLK